MPPEALKAVKTQVCVGAVDDQHGNDWYHLALIQRLSEQGEWIACNGDLEVEVVDVNDSRVMPLTRNQPVSARCRKGLYGSDRNALSTSEAIEKVRREARHLAGILPLDFRSSSGVSACW